MNHGQSDKIEANPDKSWLIMVNHGQSWSIIVNQGQSGSIRVDYCPLWSIRVKEGQLQPRSIRAQGQINDTETMKLFEYLLSILHIPLKG